MSDTPAKRKIIRRLKKCFFSDFPLAHLQEIERVVFKEEDKAEGEEKDEYFIGQELLVVKNWANDFWEGDVAQVTAIREEGVLVDDAVIVGYDTMRRVFEPILISEMGTA